LYVNGEALLDTTDSGAVPTDMNNIWLGNGHDNAGVLNRGIEGLIDDVRLYNVALTGDEIMDLVGPIVLEDFEGDLSAWTMTAGGADSAMISDDPLDATNKALMFAPQAGTPSMTMPLVIDPCDTSTTLAFRMMYMGLGDPVVNDNIVGLGDETTNDVDAVDWEYYYTIARMGGSEGTNIDYRDEGNTRQTHQSNQDSKFLTHYILLH
ncbi:LamG-like jellyroll fold domain-containing protein, partial [Planctomycetota bacterium]